MSSVSSCAVSHACISAEQLYFKSSSMRFTALAPGILFLVIPFLAEVHQTPSVPTVWSTPPVLPFAAYEWPVFRWASLT